jgi:hypothetical protein
VYAPFTQSLWRRSDAPHNIERVAESSIVTLRARHARMCARMCRSCQSKIDELKNKNAPTNRGPFAPTPACDTISRKNESIYRA